MSEETSSNQELDIQNEQPNLNQQESVVFESKAEIVKQLEVLLQQGVNEIKEQVDNLKQQFYKIHNADLDKARKEFFEKNGDDAEFQPAEDSDEVALKSLLAKYKELRVAEVERQRQEREQNGLKKQAILSELKSLAESETADISGEMEHFHNLQQQWREVGPIEPSLESDLQKQYELYQNQFYDLLSINRELRDYDFKKNLEAKTTLCEKAEALADRKDVVPAFRELLAYQEEWKNIGPVAREHRETIWARFRAAATVIFKKHQDYFAEIHSREQDNLVAKQGLCQRLSDIKWDEFTTSKQWDQASEQVAAIQTEWRTIGFAPKKDNQKIYDQYRSLVDGFYAARSAYFKTIREQLNDNMAKKQELIHVAEKLQDSTDWQKTTNRLIELQQQWKKIGVVPRKYSEQLWQQFRAACDHFFEAKKEATASQRNEEQANLEAKKAILEQIENLEIGEKNATLKKLHELMAQYQNIGFVPFREKDKLQKKYKAATDKIFDQLQVEEANRRLDFFSKNLEEVGEDRLLNERKKLLRQYDSLKAEIATAENNILFFTGKSNKSNSVITSMQKNIEKQKQQLNEIEQKINLIDQKLN